MHIHLWFYTNHIRQRLRGGTLHTHTLLQIIQTTSRVCVYICACRHSSSCVCVYVRACLLLAGNALRMCACVCVCLLLAGNDLRVCVWLRLCVCVYGCVCVYVCLSLLLPLFLSARMSIACRQRSSRVCVCVIHGCVLQISLFVCVRACVHV